MRIRIGLLILGLASVVIGAALWSIPLGFVVAGVSSTAAALLWPFKDGE